jgi:hypothetical protein
METKTLHITQLLLDPENPRHDVIQNQREIIEQLIETEKIDNLAKDIAEQGALSPLETVGVLQNGTNDEYIVLEGNRRICACILLNSPSLSPTDTLKKKFENLSKDHTIPTNVDCIIFDSRNEADHWIQLRHEGLQDGIGAKKWDSSQISRYAEKRGRKSPNIQSIKIVDFAIANGILTEDEAERLSITTIQRYLGNPIVRNVFGFTNKENLISKHDRQTFKNLVTKFLQDALIGIDVNSRSKSDGWRAYANTLQTEISPPPSEDNTETNHESPSAKNENRNPKNTKEDTKPSESSTERSKQDPAKRKYLIPINTNFAIKDKILNRVYKELKSLEVEGFEFSAAFLLRAFIERLIILYMEKALPEEAKKDMKLHVKISHVVTSLEKQNIKKGILQPLKVAASESNSLLSPNMMGAMVHSSVIPIKRELLAVWDRLEIALKTIHEKLK